MIDINEQLPEFKKKFFCSLVFPNIPSSPGLPCQGEDKSIYRRGARRWRKLYRVNGHLFQAKRFNHVTMDSDSMIQLLLNFFPFSMDYFRELVVLIAMIESGDWVVKVSNAFSASYLSTKNVINSSKSVVILSKSLH